MTLTDYFLWKHLRMPSDSIVMYFISITCIILAMRLITIITLSIAFSRLTWIILQIKMKVNQQF